MVYGGLSNDRWSGPTEYFDRRSYFTEIDDTAADDCYETEILVTSKFGTARRPHLKPRRSFDTACSMDRHLCKNGPSVTTVSPSKQQSIRVGL